MYLYEARQCEQQKRKGVWRTIVLFCIVFRYLYSAPQQPWTMTMRLTVNISAGCSRICIGINKSHNKRNIRELRDKRIEAFLSIYLLIEPVPDGNDEVRGPTHDENRH